MREVPAVRRPRGDWREYAAPHPSPTRTSSPMRRTDKLREREKTPYSTPAAGPPPTTTSEVRSAFRYPRSGRLRQHDPCHGPVGAGNGPKVFAVTSGLSAK